MSQHPTQRLKLFLFCGHNQGEIVRAEADGEADEGLLGPGQVAHQGQEAQRVAFKGGAVSADQEPAGEGQAGRRREGPGSTCGQNTSALRLCAAGEAFQCAAVVLLCASTEPRLMLIYINPTQRMLLSAYSSSQKKS